LPKNNYYNFFYYSIQTKLLRNESNLIESFKLLRILNSLKFVNYLIQTQGFIINFLFHFKIINQIQQFHVSFYFSEWPDSLHFFPICTSYFVNLFLKNTNRFTTHVKSKPKYKRHNENWYLYIFKFHTTSLFSLHITKISHKSLNSFLSQGLYMKHFTEK